MRHAICEATSSDDVSRSLDHGLLEGLVVAALTREGIGQKRRERRERSGPPGRLEDLQPRAELPLRSFGIPARKLHRAVDGCGRREPGLEAEVFEGLPGLSNEGSACLEVAPQRLQTGQERRHVRFGDPVAAYLHQQLLAGR